MGSVMSSELVNNLVAVYGSLRQGKGNHRILNNEQTEYLGTCRVEGFDMYSMGSFPFITDGDGEITVEVYRVTDETTAQRLDNLEGYPSFYNRKQVQTEYGLAWIYFINDYDVSRYQPVSDGDWVTFHQSTGF